jgi:hypothetical protein
MMSRDGSDSATAYEPAVLVVYRFYLSKPCFHVFNVLQDDKLVSDALRKWYSIY